MLRTDVKPQARFKAVRTVLKPSGPFRAVGTAFKPLWHVSRVSEPSSQTALHPSAAPWVCG